MKSWYRISHSFKKAWKKIKLIDRCLILFMLVLIMQSIYSLFISEPVSHDRATIDIIIRTTTASIFGYFLSANFIRKSNDDDDDDELNQSPPNKQDTLLAQSKAPILGKTDSNYNLEQKKKQEYIAASQTSKQQIIIATVIGLISLCALLIARDFVPMSPSAAATISQFRDFVSGCIGFLLGSPSSSGSHK